MYQHSKITRFGECFTCFGCETETGVIRIFVIFQDRPMFSHIIRKVLAKAFDFVLFLFLL